MRAFSIFAGTTAIRRSEKGVADGVATLDATGKVPLSQMPTSILEFKGTWDANTNTPTLTSGVGTTGDVYIVSVAGTTNLDGITDWQIGDWVVFDGTAWQKIDSTNLVVSVNGQTGIVVLSAGDIGFTPNGDIASNDTQAAIVEVRDDTDTKLTGKSNTGHTHVSANITDFNAAVSGNSDVSANSVHRTTTTGNPHSVNFLELGDTPGSYATGNALHKINSGATAVEETTILLTEPAANQFTLTRGTSALVIQNNLTVEAASAINQDMTTDANATLQNLTLTGLTPNSIVFVGASDALSEDTERFKWDRTNWRFLVGGDSGGGGFGINAISGGYNNAVIGGENNKITADSDFFGKFTFIAGGFNNDIIETGTGSIANSIVVGGAGHTIGGADIVSTDSAIIGGWTNTVTDINSGIFVGDTCSVSGENSVIIGGVGSSVTGDISYALGRRAKNNHNGTYVFSDNEDSDFSSSADKQFIMRFSGGVGVGTASPNSQLHIGGSFAVERLALAASGNSDDEVIIGVTDTSSPRTVTIQTADIVTGRIFIIKDESGAAGTNNITIATQAAQNIDGVGTATISSNYGSIRLYSDGSNLFTF
jgi:hypothetical protein